MAEVREAISSWAVEAKKHAGWIVVLGVVTVIAGFGAMGSPFLSGLGVVLLIGIVVAIAGVARILGVFSAGSFGQGTLAFIGGILTLVAGLILVSRPGTGLVTLTLLVGVYLLVDGIASTLLAFHVRPQKGWGSMLFSGAMGILLGFLLLKEWPLSGLWAIGTLVGVNLLCAGVSIISVGSAARSLATRVA